MRQNVTHQYGPYILVWHISIHYAYVQIISGWELHNSAKCHVVFIFPTYIPLTTSTNNYQQDGVFLLPPCCDPFNEKALRAARGASLQLPIVSGTWHDLRALMTKYDMKIMAGHPESHGSKVTQPLSKELADSLVNASLCLVLGSEGNGLSAETLQTCELVNISMEGTFESLNVSVAGGIFLFMLQHKHQINSRTLTP